MKHGANNADKGMQTERASRHIPAQCEPTTWTSENYQTNHQPKIHAAEGSA